MSSTDEALRVLDEACVEATATGVGPTLLYLRDEDGLLGRPGPANSRVRTPVGLRAECAQRSHPGG